jgi:hypothetical protein
VKSVNYELRRLYNLLRYPVTSCLLCPNIISSTLFSDILNLRSSFKMRIIKKMEDPSYCKFEIIFELLTSGATRMAL